MKKYCIIFASVCVILLTWTAYKPFDDFIIIDDVSKVQEYKIGNNSYFMSPTSIRGTIRGKIDGDAFFMISAQRISLPYINSHKYEFKDRAVHLEEGVLNKGIWSDYYKDYYKYGPGYIYYIPLGAKKGNVIINWSI